MPHRSLLSVLCGLQLLLVLGSTAPNIALVAIARDFTLSPDQMSWIVNAYVLCFAGLLLVGGRLADRTGRRGSLLVGVAAYAAACVASAVSATPGQLLASRAVQGAAAAVLIPAALGLLTLTCSTPAGRARALGAWSAVAAVGGTIGVVYAGVVTEHLSWRWIFWVNALVATVVLIFGARLLAPADRRQARLGSFGSSATATSLIAVVIVCLDGTANIPPTAWLLVPVLALAFVLSEHRSAHPLVLVDTVEGRRTGAALLGLALFSTAFGGGFFALTLELQTTWRWGPALTGLAFLPFGAALFAGSFVATRLVGRLGFRWTIISALMLVCTGLVLAAFATPSEPLTLLTALMVLPLGLGIGPVLLTALALSDASASDASLRGSLSAVAQQLGAALGVGIVGAALPDVTSRSLFVGAAAAVAIGGAALWPAFAQMPSASVSGRRCRGARTNTLSTSSAAVPAQCASTTPSSRT